VSLLLLSRNEMNSHFLNTWINCKESQRSDFTVKSSITQENTEYSKEFEWIYEIILWLFSEEQKTVTEEYITLRKEYILSEFYKQIRNLQEELKQYDLMCFLKWKVEWLSNKYFTLWQKEQESEWFIKTLKNEKLS